MFTNILDTIKFQQWISEITNLKYLLGKAINQNIPIILKKLTIDKRTNLIVTDVGMVTKKTSFRFT